LGVTDDVCLFVLKVLLGYRYVRIDRWDVSKKSERVLRVGDYGCSRYTSLLFFLLRVCSRKKPLMDILQSLRTLYFSLLLFSRYPGPARHTLVFPSRFKKKGERAQIMLRRMFNVKYRPTISEINNKLQQQRCGWHTRKIKNHYAEITRCAFILKSADQ
jgi:hypothetical protein